MKDWYIVHACSKRAEESKLQFVAKGRPDDLWALYRISLEQGLFPSARLVRKLPNENCPWCGENLPAKPPVRKRTTDIVATIEAGLTELWLHDKQKSSPSFLGVDPVRYPTGNVVYKHLCDTGLLTGCVGIEELKDIQAEGSVFFKKYFGENTIVGWGSVYDLTTVPVLYVSRDGDLVLNWTYIGFKFCDTDPALRRK